MSARSSRPVPSARTAHSPLAVLSLCAVHSMTLVPLVVLGSLAGGSTLFLHGSLVLDGTLNLGGSTHRQRVCVVTPRFAHYMRNCPSVGSLHELSLDAVHSNVTVLLKIIGSLANNSSLTFYGSLADPGAVISHGSLPFPGTLWSHGSPRRERLTPSGTLLSRTAVHSPFAERSFFPGSLVLHGTLREGGSLTFDGTLVYVGSLGGHRYGVVAHGSLACSETLPTQRFTPSLRRSRLGRFTPSMRHSRTGRFTRLSRYCPTTRLFSPGEKDVYLRVWEFATMHFATSTHN